MLVYLIHGHKGLGQLAFALALTGLVLGIGVARGKGGWAPMLDRVHRLGFMMVGRINVVLGLALLAVMHSEAGRSLTTLGPWLGLLLWGPIEVLGKRMVTANVRSGPPAAADARKVAIGTGLQFLLIVLIYGAMTMARTRGW